MRHSLTKFVSRGKGMALARLFLLGALTVILASGAATAQAAPAGGNFGRTPEVSIRQALNMKNGTQVTIRANITKSLGGNRYTISDSSGSAEVSIGPRAWEGQRRVPSGVVLIQGEARRDRLRATINVNLVTGQQGPGPGRVQQVVSVRQALDMKNGSQVTIRGRITRSLGGDRYTFTDSSGSAEVYISQRIRGGVKMSDTVLLQGEVKRDRARVTIDARQVTRQ